MSKPDIPDWSIFGAVGAAVAASACCTIPLILVGLGAGGAWLSSLTTLEPYRPLFIALAVGMMGFAIGRSRGAEDDPDCECETDMKPRTKNVLLGIGALATLGLIASPWLLPGVMDARPSKQVVSTGDAREAALTIGGMTCASCATTVSIALNRTDGVLDATVTETPPQAVVKYDPWRVEVDDLITAVESAGYSAIRAPATTESAD